MSASSKATAAKLAALHPAYLTKLQLCGLLLIGHATLRTWELAGKGPPRTRIGRRIFYRRSSVDAWLVANEQPASKRARKVGP